MQGAAGGRGGGGPGSVGGRPRGLARRRPRSMRSRPGRRRRPSLRFARRPRCWCSTAGAAAREGRGMSAGAGDRAVVRFRAHPLRHVPPRPKLSCGPRRARGCAAGGRGGGRVILRGDGAARCDHSLPSAASPRSSLPSVSNRVPAVPVAVAGGRPAAAPRAAHAPRGPCPAPAPPTRVTGGRAKCGARLWPPRVGEWGWGRRGGAASGARAGRGSRGRRPTPPRRAPRPTAPSSGPRIKGHGPSNHRRITPPRPTLYEVIFFLSSSMSASSSSRLDLNSR